MVTNRQIKAARALLAWSQETLAERSNVSYPTIARLEAEDGPLGGRSDTCAKIISSLEAAGIVFVDENGEGPGVRLRGKNSIYVDASQPASAQDQTIRGISDISCDEAGENIHLDLQMEGDQVSRLQIPYHMISNVMLALRTAGSMAAQQQQKVPLTDRTIGQPFVATGVVTGVYLQTKRIALHLQTSEGHPLQLAMDRKVAAETIELLQAELDKPEGGFQTLS